MIIIYQVLDKFCTNIAQFLLKNVIKFKSTLKKTFPVKIGSWGLLVGFTFCNLNILKHKIVEKTISVLWGLDIREDVLALQDRVVRD